MKGTKHAVLRDVSQLARGRSTRIRLRWRRLAARKLDAVRAAMAPFVGQRLTAVTVETVAGAAGTAVATVELRHGRLYG